MRTVPAMVLILVGGAIAANALAKMEVVQLLTFMGGAFIGALITAVGGLIACWQINKKEKP